MDLLHYTESGSGEPLVILHGLFGSGKNWQSLARVFSRHFNVFLVDARNHGESFHDDEMNYRVMADDVACLLRHLDIESCSLIGHSMGGKTAMLLCLEQPALVSRLIVADIAPIAYSHHYDQLIGPIRDLQLDRFDSRQSVDQALQGDIPDTLLRNFLMQNLQRQSGGWRWKVNWSAIAKHLPQLTDFPSLPADWSIHAPSRFIRGEHSDYIDRVAEREISAHFEAADIVTIADAGHWLHAEQPERFAEITLEFFRA